jgi:hypothetical protein
MLHPVNLNAARDPPESVVGCGRIVDAPPRSTDLIAQGGWRRYGWQHWLSKACWNGSGMLD